MRTKNWIKIFSLSIITGIWTLGVPVFVNLSTKGPLDPDHHLTTMGLAWLIITLILLGALFFVGYRIYKKSTKKKKQ